MSLPNFEIEKALQNQGHKLIAGVDEVGRGCIAGPVVAAAVILQAGNIPNGINDSKKLSALKRNKIYKLILENAEAVAVATICATVIDNSNIRKASLNAMRKAILLLSQQPDYIIIDGKDKIDDLPYKQQAIIKGDQKSFSIAAASIIAKVTRDSIMQELDKHYMNYGFSNHVGYGTKYHCEILKQQGPLSKIHRYSFAPIK